MLILIIVTGECPPRILIKTERISSWKVLDNLLSVLSKQTITTIFLRRFYLLSHEMGLDST